MQVQPTKIPGMLIIDLDVFPDDRGSFREAWQAEKMQALGLPDFKPVQLNVSESKQGVIRGIHAEPWEKFIHVAYGKVFCAIVDLRRQESTFGTLETLTLDARQALYLPAGLGNSFQVLSEVAVYTYLVTAHWSPENPYPAVAFDDPDLAIPWPLTGEAHIVSAKDRSNLPLKEAFKSNS